MSSLLLQQLLVGVLVIACALFSAWRLSSVRLRLRTLQMLAGWPGLRRADWLARLQARVRAPQGPGCAGCGGAGAATQKGSAPTRTPGALRR